MPEAIVLHCPSYTGKPFYDEPERRKWVPIRPQTVTDEQHHVIKRTQFPLVLAWALTPWKAQGMTLDKVVVDYGKAATDPGVLFVALSRVRHIDDL